MYNVFQDVATNDCATEEYRCPVETTCIPTEWICDGEIDCLGTASDEEKCEGNI